MMEKKCQFCDQVFHKNEHLDRHERTHTKDRPYKCSICDKHFVRNDTLKRHERLHVRDRSPSLKRKASRPVSQSPPSLQVGLYPAQPHMFAKYRKAEVTTGKNSLDNASLGIAEVGMSNVDGLSQSPSFLNVQDTVISPLSATEFNTLPFDFDIAALNQFLTSGDFNALMTQTQDISQANDSSATPIPRQYPRPSDAIRAAWFTNMEEKDLEHEAAMLRQSAYSQGNGPLSASAKPQEFQDSDINGAGHIDEAWRQNVNSILVPQVFNLGPLPSIEFLNMCYELYFQKFHALFPIIHRPTFRISGLNQFLVTAMSLIGALFVGTPAARFQAGKIFRQLNKVVLATWESALARKRQEDIVVTRTAIIGQLFALTSGNPVYMAIFFSFHGTVLAWARQTGIMTEFVAGDNFMPNGTMTAEELNKLWKDWAVMEQKKRAALGLYILDAELASLYHAPPNLRHPGNRHYYTCAKDIFDAPDAASWARAMTAHPPSRYTIRQYLNDRSQGAALGTAYHPSEGIGYIGGPDPDDEFTLYIILIGIQAQVCEAHEVDTLFAPATQHEVTTLLIAWYHSYTRWRTHNQVNSESPFCLLILWHSIFVSLFSNLNDLEIAFGSLGAQTAADQVPTVSRWATTAEARRAALHAIRVRQLLSQLSLSTVPPIHIPRVAFQTAIVYWCYIRFREASLSPCGDDEVLGMTTWREFPTAGVNVKELLRELQRSRNGLGCDQPLGPFNEILQRLGHWGIAKKLGDILNVVIHEETSGR